MTARSLCLNRDLSTVDRFLSAVESACNGAGTQRIVVDLSDITFCDVAGLRVLTKAVEAATTAGSRVTYVGTPALIRRLAGIIGLEAVFDGRP